MERVRPRIAAGLLMYRLREGRLEVFLAHPGGPIYARKDEGYWSIPKGEPSGGESLLATAMREFEEETGVRPRAPFLELGSIRQKGGKTVHAWAFEGDCPEEVVIRSNTFEMEWPPGSGRQAAFPEIDRAQFFDMHDARRKIKEGQWPLVERLAEKLGPEAGP